MTDERRTGSVQQTSDAPAFRKRVVQGIVAFGALSLLTFEALDFFEIITAPSDSGLLVLVIGVALWWTSVMTGWSDNVPLSPKAQPRVWATSGVIATIALLDLVQVIPDNQIIRFAYVISVALMLITFGVKAWRQRPNSDNAQGS